MMKFTFLPAILLIVLSGPALAQGANQVPAAPATAAAPADADMAQRMALATRMADLTPPHTAVDMVINRIVANAPEDQRATVRKSMTDAFDYTAFRDFVIKTMAETFTLPELKKMVEYHATPEADSIERKMPGYEARIQPKMTQMLDVALMVARTGKPPEIGPDKK